MTKYKFKRLKMQVFTILDQAKREFGRVRIEPAEIGWRPAGSIKWHRVSIEKFAKFALDQGQTGEGNL